MPQRMTHPFGVIRKLGGGYSFTELHGWIVCDDPCRWSVAVLGAMALVNAMPLGKEVSGPLLHELEAFSDWLEKLAEQRFSNLSA